MRIQRKKLNIYPSPGPYSLRGPRPSISRVNRRYPMSRCYSAPDLSRPDHAQPGDPPALPRTDTGTPDTGIPEAGVPDGGILLRRGGISVDCLTIIGQIEGHYLLGEGQKTTKYEHIIPRLVAVEESPEVDGMLMVLNTMGGDVEAGLAIAEMVASMSKPTVSLVLGGGHSIGVPLAVSARRSLIVPSATMTVHPVRISGTVVGVPQTYYYFSRMQERILSFICAHSAASEEKMRELLLRTDQIATDVGSILDGGEAVAVGLIDRVGGLSDALGELRAMIRESRASSGAESGGTPAPAENGRSCPCANPSRDPG